MSLAKGKGTAVGKGTLFGPGSIADTDLSADVSMYRKVVASRYQALRLDDLDAIPAGPMQITPKVDGELWFAVKHGKGVGLVAPNGRVLEGAIPVIEELERGFGAKAHEGEVVAGELFAVSKGGRPRVGDVNKALGSDGDPASLGFMAFDLVCGEKGATPPEAWTERFARLGELFAGGKRAQVIKKEDGASASDVRARFGEWVDGGKAEGLVVRVGDGRIFKVKPTFSIDAVVVGFTVREEDAAQARSLLLALLREDGTFQIIGSTGNLGTDSERKSLLATLQGSVVASDYRAVASSGEMYQFVSPELVVEVSCTDLQAEDGEGRPVRQWALSNGSDGWHRVCPVAGASLLHPVLARVRSDKSVSRPDVRAEQLAERVPVGDLGRKAAVEDLPASEVLRREVYTKETKGQTAVRKLLVWQTNKQDVDPDFPAFVVHWTDFSATRKTPLEREVRIAPTREEAEKIAEGMLASEIGKGWVRV
jgi:ATP-dependent DNA ligase